ncbi:MAG: hypothetical protein PUB76_00225 [Oscillospiraceae bacterium]|nr:hypothetical protein [Oscillospiraceae bacterium]
MICRFCGKNINSFRFCGICGKQNPIILKWNNYEECDEIKEVSDYLKSVPLPYANKYRENINRKPDVEKKEEIKPIENKPQNSNKVENAVPKLNDNIPKGKAYSNKNNQKKSNNLWKRKYLILSVFVGIVVVAAGTVAAISLGSHNNDSGKDRNDKSEVDSEDIEESTSEFIETYSIEDIKGTYYFVSDVYKSVMGETQENETQKYETTEYGTTESETQKYKTKKYETTEHETTECETQEKETLEDRFDIFNKDKKNKISIRSDMRHLYLDLENNKLIYYKPKNSQDSEENSSSSSEENSSSSSEENSLSNSEENSSSSSEESSSSNSEENNSPKLIEYSNNQSYITLNDYSFSEIDQDFISNFEFNKFIGNDSSDDKFVEDKNMYFFKLKDKNTDVMLMCSKLEGLEYFEEKSYKKYLNQDDKIVFDIVDGKGNHIKCDKDVDNNFKIQPYGEGGKGEVLKDHYIGKYMISRLSINDGNWFLLRDYNDKSSVYVVQYIKYND